MVFPGNYDEMISTIEKMAEKKNTQITEQLTKGSGCNIRLLGDAFQYITGLTLAQYIRRRKLARALQYRMESGCSLEEAGDRFGFADAATLSKAYKKEYGYSPKEATEEIVLQNQPLYMECVLSDGRTGEMTQEREKIAAEENQENKEQKMMFGVPAEQFQGIRQMLELNAVYGLDNERLEMVYRFFSEYKIPMETAFEIEEEVSLQVGGGDAILHDLGDLAVLSYGCRISLSEAEDIMDLLEHYGFTRLKDVPEGFFDIYFSETYAREGYSVPEILKILEAMKKMGYEPYEFDMRMDYALYHGGDPVETILSYEEDDAADWMDDMTVDLQAEMEVAREENRSIWELSEEEYNER